MKQKTECPHFLPQPPTTSPPLSLSYHLYTEDSHCLSPFYVVRTVAGHFDLQRLPVIRGDSTNPRASIVRSRWRSPGKHSVPGSWTLHRCPDRTRGQEAVQHTVSVCWGRACQQASWSLKASAAVLFWHQLLSPPGYAAKSDKEGSSSPWDSLLLINLQLLLTLEKLISSDGWIPPLWNGVSGLPMSQSPLTVWSLVFNYLRQTR